MRDENTGFLNTGGVVVWDSDMNIIFPDKFHQLSPVAAANGDRAHAAFSGGRHCRQQVSCIAVIADQQQHIAFQAQGGEFVGS